jgi:flagellar basal body-associated protein FliL
MPAKVARDRRPSLQREAPPVLIIVAVVLLVVALGAGAFYVYNGGWKTAAQQDEEYKHHYLPLMAAKHGDMGPLEAENKLRKEQGQPLLELPKEHRQSAADVRQKLQALQQQLQGRVGSGAAPGNTSQ